MANTDNIYSVPPPAAVPFGPWQTVGIGLGIILVSQILALFVLAVIGSVSPDEFAQTLEDAAKGDMAAFNLVQLRTVCIAAIITVLMVQKIVKSRAPGGVEEYLALHPVRWRVLRPWIGLTISYVLLAMLAESVAQSFFGIEPPPNMLFGVESNALIIAAIVLAAPMMEEVLFRGFIYSGLERSRQLGRNGAILITTLLWSFSHLQYDLFGMLLVGGFGVILCLARIRTGSLLTSAALHSVYNGLVIGLSLL